MAHNALRFDIPRAVHAARALIANPDDLPQVFTIIEALSGGTIARIVKRMQTTESGRRILKEQPDIVELLADREALAKLPDGSLGRAYLDFVETEQISAAGIRAASVRGENREQQLPEPLGYMHLRMRDTHDLWHAVTGYKGDVLGEVALLGFTLAQTRNPGIALMVSIGLLKLREIPDARRLILEGFARGRRAEWFPTQRWEEMLALPVAEVRERMRVGAMPAYQPVRSAELRAAA